ncbi:PREDICTED: ras-related protein Rab-19 [Nanorana parkeri]|uniref:ras-related protein Rab-19 n=1 Tax=Nanorana parkeri TaxID=125878 RepID=UPI0008540E61|nr:PREDICTED: ras-related protein Rab-19 [Nanorana parkeri]
MTSMEAPVDPGSSELQTMSGTGPPEDDPFDFLFKIILIGDSNVGKTCVVQRFQSGVFSDKHQNTIGVDFTVRSLNIEGKKVKVQVWDTAGQERFRTITQSYYRSAHGAIIAYDITRRQTFDSVPHWIHEVERYGAANLMVMLIGNKTDLVENRQILFEEACTLAEKFSMLAVLETSAKEAWNIDEVFLLMAKELIARNTLHFHKDGPRNSFVLDSRPVLAAKEQEKNCLCG